MKSLLNPFRYGVLALSLIFNKVLRRFLPVCLAALFLSSAVLSYYRPWFIVALAVQAGFYLLALAYGPLFRLNLVKGPVGKMSSIAYFFCLGSLGMTLGAWDFLRGKCISKWEPT
jgi:hypothetical protein